VGIETPLLAYAELADKRLAVLLPNEATPPEKLHAAMRYSCLSPGKRLRPALCMVAAEAVGGTAESVVDAACSMEMVHAFSLIHDDLPAIDDDDLRRGRPTCHVEFGEAMAILAGDALFALAFQTLSSASGPCEKVNFALRRLAQATGSDGLVGGEVMDVLAEGLRVDAAALDFIHTRKTGALIAASCEIGGALAGGTDRQVEALAAYGRHVGLAFQIADDLLNELSTAEKLGKAAGSDRARQKATYPALYGVDRAREAAQSHVARAVDSLGCLPHRRDLMEDLARYAVERGR
jgi:geranylgeranyl diphosphate synthase type II